MRETAADHGPERPYQDYPAEDLVEMLELQVDQDEALDVEIVFELAVRALEAEQQRDASSHAVRPPRVVHVTPARAPLAVFTYKRQPELERIFGENIDIAHLSHVDFDPQGKLARENCHPPALYEQVRNKRGDREIRQVGFGRLRGEGQIDPVVDDGAFTDRSAIVKTLRQRTRSLIRPARLRSAWANSLEAWPIDAPVSARLRGGQTS